MEAVYYRQRPTGPLSENILLSSNPEISSNLLLSGIYKVNMYAAGVSSHALSQSLRQIMLVAVVRDSPESPCGDGTTVRVMEFSLDYLGRTFDSRASKNSQVLGPVSVRNSDLSYRNIDLDIPTSDIYHMVMLCPKRNHLGKSDFLLPGVGLKRSVHFYDQCVIQADSLVIRMETIP